jgi:hypothetical protein
MPIPKSLTLATALVLELATLAARRLVLTIAVDRFTAREPFRL